MGAPGNCSNWIHPKGDNNLQQGHPVGFFPFYLPEMTGWDRSIQNPPSLPNRKSFAQLKNNAGSTSLSLPLMNA